MANIPETVVALVRGPPPGVREAAAYVRARCDAANSGISPVRWPADTPPDTILRGISDWVEQHRPASVRVAWMDGAGGEIRGASKGFMGARVLDPAEVRTEAPPPPPAPDPRPDPFDAFASAPSSAPPAPRPLMQPVPADPQQIHAHAQKLAEEGNSTLLISLYAIREINQAHQVAHQVAQNSIQNLTATLESTNKILVQVTGQLGANTAGHGGQLAHITQQIGGLVQAQGRTVEGIGSTFKVVHESGRDIAVSVANAKDNMSAALFTELQVAQTKVETLAASEARATVERDSAHPPAPPAPRTNTPAEIMESLARLVSTARSGGADKAVKDIIVESIKKKTLPPLLQKMVADLADDDAAALLELMMKARQKPEEKAA